MEEVGVAFDIYEYTKYIVKDRKRVLVACSMGQQGGKGWALWVEMRN